MSSPVIALVGPTCVGKTAVGITLAQRLGAEIVSADSRQIYRYMDIGTAKPTPEEQRLVRHYMIDLVDPDVRFSAGAYAQGARQAIEDLKRRGIAPLVVGGAGLYLRALMGGLFVAPEVPAALRHAIRQRLERIPDEGLHDTLRRVDPEAADRIHAHDRQRIIRALEVYEATGIPLTAWQRTAARDASAVSLRLIGLDRDRSALYDRINRRVDRMIEAGLMEEVRGLLRRGYTEKTWALHTFGYAEMLACLDGRLPLETAVERIKQRTRQYAKRQMTWFRHRDGVHWVSIEEGEPVSRISEKALAAITEA
jgi:tRNA dimethylallyltransferase